MKKSHLLAFVAALGLALTLGGRGTRSQTPDTPPPAVDAAQQAPDQAGVEPQTRGPVHEAFAKPVGANPQPNPIVPKKAPDPIEEVPPDQKPEGSNVVWIPGYWAWDDGSADFLWVSGFWRDVPPGQQWMPGYWVEADGGWQWVSGYWTGEAQAQQEVEYLPPPPPSIEAGPSVAAPNDSNTYVPGCWVYRETRYLWRPGFWLGVRPDWIYTPACYNWTPAGCVFVDGYWDYTLARRGLLFCPVRFAQPLWQRPNYFFQPNYCVAASALTSSLFVHRDFHRYQFGDYFAPQYARQGYVPWFNYHAARNVPEPLFAHYSYVNRADRRVVQDLRELYAERTLGHALRPPTTFVQQNTLIQNITVNKTVLINNQTLRVSHPQELSRHVTVIAPLTRIQQVNQTNVRMQAVTQVNRTEERKVATRLRDVSQQRRQVETRMVARGEAATRPTDQPRLAKVAMPKQARPAGTARVQVPPRPTLPQHVQRPAPKHEPVSPLRVQPRPAPHQEIKPQPPVLKPRPEVKPAPRPEVKPLPPHPTPVVKPKPQPRPEVKPAPHPQPLPRPRPEVKPVPHPQPVPKPAPKVQPVPHPQPVPKVTPPVPHPQPVPKVQPPAPHPLPAPKLQPPAPRPQPIPKVTPPVPHPQPVAKPLPHPQPVPKVQPAPKPAPKVQLPTPHPLPVPHPQPAPKATPPAPHPQPVPKVQLPTPHPLPVPHPQPAPKVQPPAPRPQPVPHPAAQVKQAPPAPHPTGVVKQAPPPAPQPRPAVRPTPPPPRPAVKLAPPAPHPAAAVRPTPAPPPRPQPAARPAPPPPHPPAPHPAPARPPHH